MHKHAERRPDPRLAVPVDVPRERSSSVPDFIRHRLNRLSRRLTGDQDVPIDAAAVGEVQFLRDLAWLTKEHAPAPPPPKKRLLIPVLFVVTAVCMTALVVVRLPSIRVDVDVLSSAITMRVATPIQLTGLSRLSLLQASEFRPAEIEDPVTLAPVTFQPPIELRPSSTGSLTLSSISIPVGALLSIQATSDPGTWRIAIEHDAAAIGATLAGAVEVSTAGTTKSMSFGRGSLVDLHAGASPSSRLEVQVTPLRVDSLLAGRRIPVSALMFEEAVQEASPGASGIVQGRGSSVLEGSIFNIALAGRETRLRARDAIEMDLASGDLRELRLEPQGLRIGFSGEARELRLGRFGGLQTLRPSYLEWLAEHHALKMAWAAAAWIFALFLGGVKWWQDLRA
jgi:hypothetical protein